MEPAVLDWSADVGATVVIDVTGGASAEQLDPDDFLRIIIDDHSASMFRLAKSIVKDSALAEDVVQESIVKAWRSFASFRHESSLRSWVLRITNNTAISTLRKRREDVRDPQMLPEGVDRDSSGPDRQVAGRLMVDDLWQALDRLDPLSRSVIVLREIEGLPYEDIADALQVALPTVKTRLFRARRILATSLSEWS